MPDYILPEGPAPMQFKLPEGPSPYEKKQYDRSKYRLPGTDSATGESFNSLNEPPVTSVTAPTKPDNRNSFRKWLHERPEDEAATARLAGTMAGGVAGALLHSSPTGMGYTLAREVLGGGMGAYAGRYLSGIGTGETPGQAMKAGANAAMEDIKWGTLSPTVLRALKVTGAYAGKKAVGILGNKFMDRDNTEVMDMAKIAINQNIPIGTRSLDPGALVNRTASIFSVYPLLTRSAQAGYKKTAGAAKGIMDNKLETMAPNITLLSAGHDVFNAVRKAHKDDLKLAEKGYNRVYDLARELGDPAFLPTRDIIRTAQAASNKVSANRLNVVKGVDKQGNKVVGKMDVPKKTPVDEFVEKVGSIDDQFMSIAQYHELSKELKSLGRTNPKEAYKLAPILQEFRASFMMFDIAQLNVAAKSHYQSMYPGINITQLKGLGNKAEEIRRTLDSTNDYYKSLIERTNNPQAGKFMAVDKNTFSGRKEFLGSREKDELINTLVSTRSVDALGHVKQMLGKNSEEFDKIGRSYLSNAIDRSKVAIQGQPAILDYGKLYNNLGLDTGEGREFFKALYPKIDHESFVDVLRFNRHMDAVPPPNPSDMIKRKLAWGASLEGVVSPLVTAGRVAAAGTTAATIGVHSVYAGAAAYALNSVVGGNTRTSRMVVEQLVKMKNPSAPPDAKAVAWQTIRRIMAADLLKGKDVDSVDNLNMTIEEMKGWGKVLDDFSKEMDTVIKDKAGSVFIDPILGSYKPDNIDPIVNQKVRSTPIAKKTQYDNLFMEAESRFEIPSGLLKAVAIQESNINTKAHNKKSDAKGMMQIVPKWHPGVDPFNPDSAIPYAAKYLRKMYNQFGTWELALAAYNAGPGNVRKYKGIPPFKETRDYVSNILA